MTAEEHNEQEAAILSSLPVEFHSALSYAAYERGHAYGYDECLIILREMVDALAEPIRKFEGRVRWESVQAVHEARKWQ
jgi:hypothetical protein